MWPFLNNQIVINTANISAELKYIMLIGPTIHHPPQTSWMTDTQMAKAHLIDRHEIRTEAFRYLKWQLYFVTVPQPI